MGDDLSGNQNASGNHRKRQKPGILRLDISKPRRSSGGSVEFRTQPKLLGESQSPVTPQLSVKWAEGCIGHDYNYCYEVDSRMMQDNSKAQCESEETRAESETIVDRSKQGELPTPLEGPEINSEDEDYSISVSAIMQRRASTRGRRKSYRSPRRGSSPMDALSTGDPRTERRRSSVYTTSSGDTIISIDEGTNQESTQEQILDNIRLHKEVLNSVKYQPWSMKRKLRLLRQAKGYVARHEGVLQERYAMSRSTKDLWARFKILLGVRWQHWKRESANIFTIFIPWESRIKEIESHFGSVVASYFTFLRWLFWVNIIITVFLTAFVIVPEAISTPKDTDDERKVLSPPERKTADNFMTLWEFGGHLKYSPIFYGFYSNITGAIQRGYHLPLAYFFTGLFVYVYSFIAILRKMAENSRSSKLSSKDDECVFSWKLFTGWDFMIGHAETAHNRMASVVLGFKEALLEEAEKKKDTRNWKVILLRIVVNLIVLALLVGSAYAVVFVVGRSYTQNDPKASWWRRNEISVVMNIISYTYPTMFELLGFLENFHPRQQLRLQLARIMVLHFLNLYSLIFAQFREITDIKEQQTSTAAVTGPLITTVLMERTTATYNSFANDFETTTQSRLPKEPYCFNVSEDCFRSTTSGYGGIVTTLLLLNLTTTAFPDVWNNLSSISAETTQQLFDQSTTDLWSTDISPTITPTAELSTFEDFATARAEYDLVQPEELDYLLNTTEYYEYGIEPDEAVGRARRRRNAIGFTENPLDGFNATHINSIMNEMYQNLSEQISSEMPYDYETQLSEDELRTTLTTFILNLTTSFPDDFNDTTSDYHSYITDKVYQFIENVTSTMVPDLDYLDNCTKTICVTSEMEDTTEIYDETTPRTSFNFTESTVKEVSTMQPTDHSTNASQHKNGQDLRQRCWETMFGQELVKLIVSDLFVTIGLILLIDFLRSLFVRYMNRCWCWDLEKRFPQYGDFKVAENILSLIKDQGQVWMGLFFSPGLAVIYLIKLAVMMYIRSWAVLSCNVPHEVVFRASRSNNFYLTLLLTMLFLCVLPVAHAIVWIKPSIHCGPFSGKERIYHIFTDSLRTNLPHYMHHPMEIVASPSTVIPLLLLLVLIIYYLVSLTNALRVANQDLKDQLRKERSEERRKMLKLTEEYASENRTVSITSRWKKVLEATSPITPTPGIGSAPPDYEESKAQARKELLARIMKKALRKGSATSEEESIIGHADNGDDGTDTEHHDSLPHDGDEKPPKQKKTTIHRGRKARKPSLMDIVQLARRESVSEQAIPSRITPPVESATASQGDLTKSPMDDNDPEANVRIVSERRRSLLKRQPKVENLPEATNTSMNYDINNEKDKEVEKAFAQKSTQSAEPEVFKFEKENGVSKPDEEKTRKSVMIDKLTKEHPGKNKSTTKSFPNESATSKDAPSTSGGGTTSFPKGRRKFGSFLALVKEAAKKLDAEGTGKKIEKTNIPNVPPTITEHAETSATSSGAEGEAPTKSSTTKTPVEHDPPKREDSQASIWSENIPVITISKTESKECILEGSDKEPEASQKDKPKKS